MLSNNCKGQTQSAPPGYTVLLRLKLDCWSVSITLEVWFLLILFILDITFSVYRFFHSLNTWLKTGLTSVSYCQVFSFPYIVSAGREESTYYVMVIYFNVLSIKWPFTCMIKALYDSKSTGEPVEQHYCWKLLLWWLCSKTETLSWIFISEQWGILRNKWKESCSMCGHPVGLYGTLCQDSMIFKCCKSQSESRLVSTEAPASFPGKGPPTSTCCVLEDRLCSGLLALIF